MKSIVTCLHQDFAGARTYFEQYGFGVEIQRFLEIDIHADEIIAEYNTALPVQMPKYMHAPFWDLCLGSSNKMIADVTRKYFDFSYDVGLKFGCEGIIVHHGFVPNTTPPDLWINNAAKFFHDFFMAHPEPMTVYMENQLERSPQIMMDVIDAVSDTRLMVNLDVGHVHAFSDVPAVSWIEQLGSRIGYVHLHNNFGSLDEHNALDNGSLDMASVLAALESHAPDAIWSLEFGLDRLPQSIAYLQSLGYVK